ncbi:hypothetical protein DM01DRAFT_1331631 [Hesseltinella vesiculosa]|uniref:Large ribosomal subunit protein bL32m n=1 Tax=Hesseltinella vesiculosa TaxID=101127 RepID=A0A1X2GVV1_9FUNG|nr:hypothetical protein DM01DRAFT_1331631 [Hesseltinella vesiculosa]
MLQAILGVPARSGLLRSTATVNPLASLSQWINNNGIANTGNTFQVPEWLGPILWAAPKKKTSHSKKRMRASNKGLKQKENITACPACGNTKLSHHACKHCYKDFKQQAKLDLA